MGHKSLMLVSAGDEDASHFFSETFIHSPPVLVLKGLFLNPFMIPDASDVEIPWGLCGVACLYGIPLMGFP